MLTKPDVNRIFSDRISDVPRSFIREILKVALQPGVISFAGGLPNRDLFPKQELQAATQKVFDTYGVETLQYSSSEGFLPLREYISERYRSKMGLEISADSILITSGSQQGLDLLGKVVINEGDNLIIEAPGYLGAIQAFTLYKPDFCSVPVREGGMDLPRLADTVQSKNPKLIYTVPNFQNPSGISYSLQCRQAIANILHGTDTLLIEDDPYGDLRFRGTPKPSFYGLIPENTVLLGSFSKVIVPGFRLGWVAAPKAIMKKLIIAKQATDLHTSHFTQCIVYQYLQDNDLDQHIRKIVAVYRQQKNTMIRAIKDYFPSSVTHTDPEGGMFLWAELPRGYSALDLFELAVGENVVFVPGDPFYISQKNTNTLRLNFSSVDDATIEAGIGRLGNSVHKLIEKKVQLVESSES